KSFASPPLRTILSGRGGGMSRLVPSTDFPGFGIERVCAIGIYPENVVRLFPQVAVEPVDLVSIPGHLFMQVRVLSLECGTEFVVVYVFGNLTVRAVFEQVV